MRAWLWGAGLLALTACGSGKSTFDGGDDNNNTTDEDAGGGCDPLTGCIESEAEPMEAAPPCKGLQCQQVSCGGSATTSITGKVFAPNGTLPLYNVIVYVPNAALDPITNGAVCDKCGAQVSGSPIATALTDPTGKFVLKNVPVGSNIPVVVQVGKWRRKFTVPSVNQCVDNPIKDGTFRLPKNRMEGDMPRIAMVTGGCDPLACILSKVGIDNSEFGDSSAGPHKVVWYNGGGGSAPGSPQSAPTALWNNLNELKKFDIVINSCECSEQNQNKTSPQTLEQYANSGGRVFGSHFHYTWQRNLIPAWKNTASWSAGGSSSTPDLVDMSFPKGKAFAQWLMAPGVQASTVLGEIPLQVKTRNVADVTMPTTRWIHASGGPPTTTHYLSFNTPVGMMPDKQCGKVVFAGLHVSQGSVGANFPAQCGANFTPDEKALTFLFFDLSSCIQDEMKEPEPPPIPK